MTTRTRVKITPSRQRAPRAAAAAPQPDNITYFKTACSSCKLRELCPPCCGLSGTEMDVANRLVFHRTRVRRGQSLYRTGDRFTSLYAVRSGFFKFIVLLQDGRREQVTGFSMAGDVLGVDGIATERHTCNAIALENSDVCAIPFSGLQQLAHEIPSLQRQFRKTLSREIVREHGMLLLLGKMNADERLATFLLNLSQRFAEHGYSSSEFNMRMTREEIGSYLGLSLETVSRTLSRLQERGLVSVQQKIIYILDSAGLRRVIGRELP